MYHTIHRSPGLAIRYSKRCSTLDSISRKQSRSHNERNCNPRYGFDGPGWSLFNAQRIKINLPGNFTRLAPLRVSIPRRKFLRTFEVISSENVATPSKMSRVSSRDGYNLWRNVCFRVIAALECSNGASSDVSAAIR